MLKNIATIFIIVLLASCNSAPTTSPQQVLALKEMNELVSVEYVVNKVIKASDDKTWYKLGDRKILMTCQATLKAGIDFSKLNADNIAVDGKTIRLRLPRASLISLNIKPEDIKVVYEDVSTFRSQFTSAEKNELAAQAEKQIRASVDSLGILHTAEANASLFVSNFLKQLGYENIAVQFEGDNSPQILN